MPLGGPRANSYLCPEWSPPPALVSGLGTPKLYPFDLMRYFLHWVFHWGRVTLRRSWEGSG